MSKWERSVDIATFAAARGVVASPGSVARTQPSRGAGGPELHDSGHGTVCVIRKGKSVTNDHGGNENGACGGSPNDHYTSRGASPSQVAGLCPCAGKRLCTPLSLRTAPKRLRIPPAGCEAVPPPPILLSTLNS